MGRPHGCCFCLRRGLRLLLVFSTIGLTACGAIRPVGLIYTNIRLPLARNLQDTPVPKSNPATGRVLEIKEPFSGFGVYARMDSNAIGDIALKNGLQTFYFADRQIFSILGIWSTNKTILYGE